MSAYKDSKKGTWYVQLSYKDWLGKQRHTCKRGFESKKDALDWEKVFMDKLAGTNDMSFETFAQLYLDTMKTRIKESTFCTKEAIIVKRIIPFFKTKKINEITNQDVIKWQNEMMCIEDETTHKKFSKSYLKTLHNQLSAMLNHAVRYYDLKKNPAQVVGNMGTDKEVEMHFWTLEQYEKFAQEMMDDPIYYVCFEILYWCGIREGELLALTPADIDLKNKLIDINKTFHHLNGRNYTTDPKTRKSKRKVSMPDFLCEEIDEYFKLVYKLQDDGRMFPITKSSLTNAMARGTKKAGLTHIRIHDLRHSHVSLLINMGYSVVAIGDRVGHESSEITFRYAHLFPNVQSNMADKLNTFRGGNNNEKL